MVNSLACFAKKEHLLVHTIVFSEYLNVAVYFTTYNAHWDALW